VENFLVKNARLMVGFHSEIESSLAENAMKKCVGNA
jgi:hypothetical protein